MNEALIPAIETKIYLLRGHNVMLSQDLAILYGVTVSALHQAIKRNPERFPADFIFPLSEGELEDLKSHLVTSSWGGFRRGQVYAFTEQGVAMLSSVLRSPRAIQVNVAIMRAFVQLRQMLASHEDLASKLEELEEKYDEQFRVVFEAIRDLMIPPDPPQRRIGFHREGEI
ncbi:MAG: ORF6N domain-containing protein [Verrucomicrobiota bacterium]|nr:ORF6N domain-containing protein [Verrucomicrobiota bacterium]